MQAMVNFRMDADLKSAMEELCKQMGMSMTTAFTIFASKVCQERRIPFEITAPADPFYNKSNISYLEKVTAEIDNGKAHLTEHELIEV